MGIKDGTKLGSGEGLGDGSVWYIGTVGWGWAEGGLTLLQALSRRIATMTVPRNKYSIKQGKTEELINLWRKKKEAQVSPSEANFINTRQNYAKTWLKKQELNWPALILKK